MSSCFVRFGRIYRLLLAMAAIGFGVLSGCGGSGDSGSNPTPGPNDPARRVSVTVNWAARSRAIDAPTSAQSVVIRVKKAKQGDAASDVVLTEDRKDDPAAYSATYESDDAAYTGKRTIEVTFFAAKGGLGQSVASATKNADINTEGAITDTFTNIPSQIATVEVPAQTLNAGQEKYLTYAAKSATGEVIALAPGSAFFEVVTGKDSIMTANGEVGKGIAGGAATVRASVDGVMSEPAQFTVIASVKIALVGNPDDPQVISFQQVLAGKKVQYAAFSSIPDPGALQAYDVLMIMGDTPSFAAIVGVSDAGKVKDYLNTGRGVVLLSNAPALLSGGGDLTAISSWFGGVKGQGQYYYKQFNARTDAGKFPLPPSIANGSVVWAGSGMTDIHTVENATSDLVITSGASIGAMAYELPGGGRVYYQFHQDGLNSDFRSKVLDLLLAGTNWTAKR